MARSTIIFGNGLSMALDQDHFYLANAIRYIWEHENVLSDDERRQIAQCLPGAVDRPPEGEGELDTLHIAVTACGFLDNLSGEAVEWLSQQGQQFPKTIETFVHRVATHLHNYAGALPEEFVQPLCSFLKDTKSHVATLNYDKLLYDALYDHGLLNGFKYLVDGMWSKGFKADNLERKHGRKFGYYLHLHGSPRFYGRSPPKKMPRELLEIDSDLIGEHVVLTHVRHKPSVIAASKVLSAYWERLDVALDESDEVIIFGYGGMDDHLNRQIKRHSSVRIRVVEWDQSSHRGSGVGEQARLSFWKRRTGADVELIHMDDILDFRGWQRA